MRGVWIDDPSHTGGGGWVPGRRRSLLNGMLMTSEVGRADVNGVVVTSSGEIGSSFSIEIGRM